MFWIAIGVVLATLVAALIALSAVRDGGGTESDLAAERGPVHVHGLGMNPGDGAPYIATHTGMWRVARGSREPEPVGRSRQDTMGFTVAGANHFLGSGHPDNLEEPPLLGLIESFDSGATWKPISLRGEADFHVLRAVGKRIYGYDVSHARLMVSTDGGTTWAERKPKAAVLDLAPHPAAPDRLLASTEAGLLASVDAGTTWTHIGRAVGLLGWPAPDRLFLVTGAGRVLLSTDGGGRWSEVGSIGGPPTAFFARTPEELYAAVHGSRILRSRNGGRSWRAVTT